MKRKIVQLIMTDDENLIAAVADDGTAWRYVEGLDFIGWEQIPPLPDAEEPRE